MGMNWKVTAVLAGIAAFFSLVGGLFGGVQFGAILFRMLLSGAGVGALVFGARLLLQQLIPELFGAVSEDTEEEETPVSREREAEGGNLNIVLEDEPSPSAETDVFIGNAEADEVVSPSDQVAAQEPDQVGELDIVADEESDVEIVTPSIVAGSELPSFDGLENSFSSAPSDLGVISSVDGGASSVDILGEEHDPKVIAQAVQTIMNKDQKG